MPESIGSWPAEKFGRDLILHLRSRTMPGLPHIGVLGPNPDDTSDSPVDIDDSDTQQVDSIFDTEEDELDWNFVPNKMKYQLTIKPIPENRNVTKVDFYIRIREGCDADVGKDLEKTDRNPKYILTEEQLQHAFRHYVVYIFTEEDILKSSAKLVINGIDHDIPKNQLNIHDNVVEIFLLDQSDPFLNYERGSPMLVKQQYNIHIRKEVDNTSDGHKIIKVDITNQSKKTKRSTLPKLKENETEEECRNRMKISGKKKKIDLELSPLWPDWRPNLWKQEGRENNAEGNRYGYLMEFNVSETLSSSEEPIGPRDLARITNAVFDYSELNENNKIYSGKVTFRDHAIFKEEVPKMKSGSAPTKYLQTLEMHQHLGKTLEEDLKYATLNKFQEDAIKEIHESQIERDVDTFLISARTAGGKTEAFLTPILDFCMKTREQGVKAIIFYPTKALANDQASRFIKILYYLNKRSDRKITLGILHGDIARNDDNLLEEDVTGLPFECPKCAIGLLKPITPDTMICDNHNCAEKLDFVSAYTRSQVYSKPPDILITNPDTLIWDLMLRPEHHSIFGRSIFACRECGLTYSPSVRKTKCENPTCRMGLEKITPIPPSFIVFDEVHLFKGSFGINCSYVLSRLEYTIKKYAKELHSKPDHRITRIGSTATISNQIEFVKKFFNTADGKFKIIPANKEKASTYYEQNESDTSFKRHHVFVMPYAYASDSTVGMTIQYLEAHAMLGKPPTRLDKSDTNPLGRYLQILTFVNAIKSSNSLISQTRRTSSRELTDLQVDGHTTDFDRSQRSIVERKFNTQDLHVVFATSTLEVGVDFRNIHCIIINGFPYSFNDYLQRIGRGGRRNDSLIITVCQNWKPVDHYYYTHGKNALQKQHENIEPVPITRDNSEAMKKHMQGALLDFIVRNKDYKNYDLDDIRTLTSIENERKEINEEILASCGVPDNIKNDAALYLDEFVSFITHMAKTAGSSGKPKKLTKRFMTDLNPRYNLTSLRSTDPEVTVEVFWNR